MSTKQIANLAKAYFEALRQLILHPSDYFSQSQPFETYWGQLLFALPPVVICSLLAALVNNGIWWGILCLLSAYLAIGGWMAGLKYILLIFGERRTFKDLLHISAASALSLLTAWIPNVGLPLCALLTGLLSYYGLVYYLNMNKGAAMAAIALPVVLCGFGGSVLSFIFLWLASLSTLIR